MLSKFLPEIKIPEANSTWIGSLLHLSKFSQSLSFFLFDWFEKYWSYFSLFPKNQISTIYVNEKIFLPDTNLRYIAVMADCSLTLPFKVKKTQTQKPIETSP